MTPVSTALDTVTRPPAAAGKQPSGRPIRVLYFVSSFLIGGTERQATISAHELQGPRFDVRMACFDRRGPLYETVEHLPCEHFELASFYSPRLAAEMARFALWLRRNPVDVVHATGLYPNVFAIPAARAAGVPAIIGAVRDLGDMWGARHRRLQKLACRCAHRVIANSEAVRRRLLDEGYPPGKLSVIYNGVSCGEAARPDARAYLRAELGIPSDAPVIGVIARLTPVKGIEYLLDAAARLGNRFPTARYVIIGDTQFGESGPGPGYRERLGRQAGELGIANRVIFTGFRTDVAQLMAGMDLSVLPSLSEGLSNVLLESMSIGLPVVATRVGGNIEIVEDGVTGFLVPRRDPEALAETIGRLLEHPLEARRMGSAGRRRVRERFSVESMVADTAGLYESLVAARRGRSRAAGETTT